MSKLRLIVLCFWVACVAWASGCGTQEDAQPTANSGGEAASTTADAAASPAPTVDLHPIVKLQTSLGEITIKLDAEKAPVSAENFLYYVSSGHYDGTLFHEVHPGFIALAGGYDAQLKEKPADAPIRNEAHNGLKNRRGTIAMARSADVIDSSTCQFYINLADNPHLDHTGDEPDNYGYCVFGEVVEGLELVERIAKSPTKAVDGFAKLPVEEVAIRSARRVR